MIKEGSLFSSIELDDFHKIKKGVYVSHGWDEDAYNNLVIEIEVGMGSVSIVWED